MFSKRYVVYREVIEWDSDKAFHGTQFTDEHRRQSAESIIATRRGWKMRELPTAHKQEAGDAKLFPNRSSAPETQTAPVEAGAVNSQENNNL